MKVIKEGKLPGFKKRTLRGTCTNCGCVVEEEYEEKIIICAPVILCPTDGCCKPIFMFKKTPENL